MSFFCEGNVHSLPEGSDSPSRLALEARCLGFSCLIICNHTGFEKVFMPEAASSIQGMEVVMGIEVMAENAKALHSRARSARTRYPFVAVHGGSEEVNRAACEDPSVDLLVHPEEGRKALGIPLVKAAQENDVAIGFDLSPMVCLRSASRSRWMELVRRNLTLIRKFEVPAVITSGAMSHLDLRTPRDLIALAEVVGFETSEAKESLLYPLRILDKNRKSWASPGVEIL